MYVDCLPRFGWQRRLRMSLLGLVCIFAAGLVAGCATDEAAERACPGGLADITSVTISGAPGHPVFTVGVTSPDAGCGCYADWWEVVGLDGTLLERQTFTRPHTTEQPFTSSGEALQLSDDLYVIVRAHMAGGDGYGGQAFKGSVRDGFQVAAVDADFAPKVISEKPLPGKCSLD